MVSFVIGHTSNRLVCSESRVVKLEDRPDVEADFVIDDLIGLESGLKGWTWESLEKINKY